MKLAQVLVVHSRVNLQDISQHAILDSATVAAVCGMKRMSWNHKININVGLKHFSKRQQYGWFHRPCEVCLNRLRGVVLGF